MDAELQAIPWMDQPALAPVGSAFCRLSPEAAWDLIIEKRDTVWYRNDWALDAVGGEGHDFADEGHRGLDRLR
jgi:hypothetical protein